MRAGFATIEHMASTTFELLIKPRRGWEAVDFRELWLYRELFGFLIWRDIKIRYKQTLLGVLGPMKSDVVTQ